MHLRANVCVCVCVANKHERTGRCCLIIGRSVRCFSYTINVVGIHIINIVIIIAVTVIINLTLTLARHHCRRYVVVVVYCRRLHD